MHTQGNANGLVEDPDQHPRGHRKSDRQPSERRSEIRLRNDRPTARPKPLDRNAETDDTWIPSIRTHYDLLGYLEEIKRSAAKAQGLAAAAEALLKREIL